MEVASDAPLMVVTGGPGCGKTTVVQTLVKLWAAQNKVVRIAAPTGGWVGAGGGGGHGGATTSARPWLRHRAPRFPWAAPWQACG
jgi:ABC-type oligopeptide transport system ATPase subunit